MKKIYILSFLAMPLTLLAQTAPTINTIENHTISSNFSYVNCSDTLVDPGPGGPNQHWMFDHLHAADTTPTQVVSPSSTPHASQFPNATFAFDEGGGNYTFFAKTATGTYMVGRIDNGQGLESEYPDSALYGKRPMNYNDVAMDTFTSTQTQSPLTLSGGGTVKFTADGWGMLHLPEKAYFDVLRVKMEFHEADSVTFPTTINVDIKRTAYFWYSNAFTTPLLIWDSTDVTSSFGNFSETTVAFIFDPILSVKNPRNQAYAFNGNLNNSSLAITGQFEAGREYGINLVNLNGQKIFASSFVASGSTKNFDLGKEIPSGIYLVSIMKTGDIKSAAVIKLIKD